MPATTAGFQQLYTNNCSDFRPKRDRPRERARFASGDLLDRVDTELTTLTARFEQAYPRPMRLRESPGRAPPSWQFRNRAPELSLFSYVRLRMLTRMGCVHVQRRPPAQRRARPVGGGHIPRRSCAGAPARTKIMYQPHQELGCFSSGTEIPRAHCTVF